MENFELRHIDVYDAYSVRSLDVSEYTASIEPDAKHGEVLGISFIPHIVGATVVRILFVNNGAAYEHRLSNPGVLKDIAISIQTGKRIAVNDPLWNVKGPSTPRPTTKQRW